MKAKKVILGLILAIVLLSLACKHPAPVKMDAAAFTESITIIK